jgi:hypothetical protein
MVMTCASVDLARVMASADYLTAAQATGHCRDGRALEGAGQVGALVSAPATSPLARPAAALSALGRAGSGGLCSSRAIGCR